MSTDIPTVVSPPSFADQVAAIDAIAITELAARIDALGARPAMSASTVEVVAIAKRMLALHTLAELTLDMLLTADRLQPAMQNDPAALKALRLEVSRKISVVGFSLEALGYGPPATEEEKTDVTPQD